MERSGGVRCGVARVKPCPPRATVEEGVWTRFTTYDFELVSLSREGGLGAPTVPPEKLISFWVVVDISLVYQIERVRKS